ncbi:uncharacterized protein LOC127101935 [Lathyrus oleraceus]|uniref:uncharacterized protein LOC127101935 n=1 Tax=Pisum sativum TaxID=3888 RepID=UPI0021D15AD8|nr:uncharacterized protein LOC127101935 [Pisum sativum]
MGATYLLVSIDYAKRLGLKLSFMVGSRIVDTPTLGSVTTSWVCFNFPLTIFSKSFGMDLVCLPLRNLDVIIRMNWLEFNHVRINSYDKAMSFPEFDASDELFVSAKKIHELVKDEAKVFMILASMKAKIKYAIGELPLVCGFPEVFPNDISDFPPEREVNFDIYLVPGTSSISMALYMIPASELSELNKELEDLLE